MQDLIIRPGNADDIDRLRWIERDALRRFADIQGYEPIASLDVRDRAEHLAVLQDGACFVAGTAAQVYGFVLLLPLDGHAHLLELDIACDYQGRGIGSKLMAAAEAWARNQGFSAITLTCYRDIPWQATSYAKKGYSSLDALNDRPQLTAIIDEEKTAGYASWPRLVMQKPL